VVQDDGRQGIAGSLSDWIDRLIGYPAIIMVAFMTITVLIGVFSRYLLNSPVRWTEEVARYTMIWMGLLGMSLALKRDEHIGVEFFVTRLPRPLQVLISFVVKVLVAYYLFVLFKQGLKMALDARRQVSPAMRISMVWPLLAVPVAAGLTLIQLLLTTIASIRKNQGRPQSHGEKPRLGG
jgi:TRAP-type C4-dicarboxylate transport system permease small subunit